MGHDARKPVFGGLRTTQAQTSLRIRAVWSAPLLFASYLDLQNFNFLASLCSWGDWFESCFVRNPEDRFGRIETHIKWKSNCVISLCPHIKQELHRFLCSQSDNAARPADYVCDVHLYTLFWLPCVHRAVLQLDRLTMFAMSMYLHICTRCSGLRRLSTCKCTAYLQHNHCVLGTIGISIWKIKHTCMLTFLWSINIFLVYWLF